MKKVLICGGAGFIGHHLARRLMEDKAFITVADIKFFNEFCSSDTFCNRYLPLDLTREYSWEYIKEYGPFDEIYQLAANMGGAGFVFTGDNDFVIMRDSCSINMHAINYALKTKTKIFLSSSACIYPSHNQIDPNNPLCSESSAYPANPDSEYGWEKLFAERLYMSAFRNFGLETRIARFHNIFGPEGTYDGGREKAPAALSRKVAVATDSIDIWGPGDQTRSFLYIDECVDGIIKLMQSDVKEPINIGSEEMISINDLAKMIIKISGKKLSIRNIPGPVGVMGRNSDNKLIKDKLGWAPSGKLLDGIEKLYKWIENQVSTKI